MIVEDRTEVVLAVMNCILHNENKQLILCEKGSDATAAFREAIDVLEMMEGKNRNIFCKKREGWDRTIYFNNGSKLVILPTEEIIEEGEVISES